MKTQLAVIPLIFHSVI